MEKRKLTIFIIFILSSFSIYAEMIKEGFLISGIKIDEAYKNEILLEEESYKIDESSFYNCVYKLRNTNNKNSKIASRFVRNFSEKSHSNQAAFCSFSKSIFCSRRVSALM